MSNSSIQSALKASKAVDRQLGRYRSMRDFAATSEPRGNSEPQFNDSALPFVIQKHAATRLHYDFRLGWRGVLKSWAVAKGPSYYPGDKRLAVQVEDHPIEYGGFEGIIPKGQYGGGTVMVWDFGDWVPQGDVDLGLKEGHLKFELRGQKLKGSWALVRMHGHGGTEAKPNWLLIKEKDPFARIEKAEAITDEAANSAVTSRSLDQIASSEDHVWNSHSSRRSGGRNGAQADRAKESSKNVGNAQKNSRSAMPPQSGVIEEFPKFIPPQLATLAVHPPASPDWIHELKLDGYRTQIHIRSNAQTKSESRQVGVFTRTGLDWTSRMSGIAHAASRLQVNAAILDGEVVVLDQHGVSNFARLQEAFQEGNQDEVLYFAFDLLHLDGRSLRDLPLLRRKEALTELLTEEANHSRIRLSEHLSIGGPAVFSKACSLGAEGVVSKLGSSSYISGRSTTWLKAKCTREQEFVIAGFTLPSNGSSGVGALLLGYFEDGLLRYAGRCGTGFTQYTQKTLRASLNKIVRKTAPFNQIPQSARRGVHWVAPSLVAQIAFATWTRDGLVRQAAFKGLREDKPPQEIIREALIPSETEEHSHPTAAEKAGPQFKTRTSSAESANVLHLTHPDKILDETSGMTKLALAQYYDSVAGRMLPHLAGRPLSVVRCPEGSGKPCFFQKHIGPGLPRGIKSIPIPNRKTGKMEDYLTIDTSEGLVGMAQLGVLEIHPWGSRNDSLEKPDRIVFDLDPDAAIGWTALAASALDLRQRLKKLGLTSFLKSTGGKGLHVVVPIEPNFEWPQIKQFAHDIVLAMEKENPSLYITKMTKAARANRIYLDYLRNDREATAVAPWSPRARPGVPIAMTLDWKELATEKAPSFHVTDAEQWKERLKRDPWKTMDQVKQTVPEALLRRVRPQ